MSLGTTISRLRAEKKLSQGDLADALGGVPSVRQQMGDRHQRPGAGQTGKAEPAFRHYIR